MRIAMWLVIGTCLAYPLIGSTAQGAILRPLGIEAESGAIVEAAGPRCGRSYHWVRGYRSRSGHWIKGHCVRNKRHR